MTSREITLNNVTRTAPNPSKEALELFQDLYYKQMMIFGRDKLFKYIQENHENVKLSRRQIADWLKQQEINQLNTKHTTAKNIKSTIMKAPHKQLAIDLVDLSNHEKKGYKWLFNAVDLFSKYTYSVPMKNKTDKVALDAFKKIH